MFVPAAERFHHLALTRDAVGGGAVLGERVAAPRFGKAPFQFGAGAIEEHGFDGASAGRAQLLDPLDEQRRPETAAAAVDPDRERPVRLAAVDRRLDQRFEQREREVVDAFPAQIFERSEEHTSELKSLMRTSYAVFC